MLKKIKLRNRRKKCIRKIICGSKYIPRVSIFRSDTNIIAQVINDYKSYTIASFGTYSKKLKHMIKYKNKTQYSYLVGYYLGKMLYRKGIRKISVDRNGFKYVGRVKNLINGIRITGIII